VAGPCFAAERYNRSKISDIELRREGEKGDIADRHLLKISKRY
jgi:hypothetical protein